MRRAESFFFMLLAAGGLASCATTAASAPAQPASASTGGPATADAASGSAVPADEPFSEQHASPNGLITSHYPATFAAKEINEAGLLLARDLQEGRDEAVMLIAIDEPISNDVGEFARVMFEAQTKNLSSYAESWRKKSAWSGQPAVELLGTWKAPNDVRPVVIHGWAFIRNGHGYMFGYMAFQTDVPAQEPILRKILDAVDFVK